MEVVFTTERSVVPLAGLEPALLAETDFESVASTTSATGARTCAGQASADYTSKHDHVNSNVPPLRG